MSQSMRRILVVDDEVDSCQNLLDILTDLGYEADIALDGPGALQLIQEHSYQVAILDLRMPGMRGTDLFLKLRAHSPEMKAILVSAYVDDEASVQAHEARMEAVLVKPVNVGRLLTLIEKLIA